MKKLILTLLFTAPFYFVNAQLVVEAPVLEAMQGQSLMTQLKSYASQAQQELNTLNTYKQSVQSFEKLKDIDKRITKINENLKRLNSVTDVIKNVNSAYSQAKKVRSYIGNDSQSVSLLNQQIQELEGLASSIKMIMGNGLNMNDYERMETINNYKKEVLVKKAKIASMEKRYSFIQALD